MERNCRRNLKREEINGIGCMWVFISLFGSNQKRLLMDMKRGSKRVSGNEMKQLTCSSCESSHESVEKLTDGEDIDVSIASDDHVETEVCKNLGDESEEKFKEIIKRLIAQKEGEIQTCKDLLEAFHVLDSEEESFLKKISHEDVQRLGDSKRVEEEKPQVVSKQEAVVIPKRKSSFFSRKWKSEERRNRSQVAKTIVVLKPGPNSLDLDSSSGLHSNGNKSKTGRTFSRFLIGLIKRRLQSAVGKKSCDVPIDRSQNCCMQEEVQSKSDEEKPLCNETTSEDANEDTVHTNEDSNKIMSGLYIAAKKHLSEMLANGDIDVNLPDKEVPRILGKILSLPEFCSPTNSPRLIPTHDLVSNLSPLTQTTEEPATNDLIDENSDKDDDTLFTIDVSVPIDYGKETENIDKEEKPEIDPLSESCSSSISPLIEYVDEDVLEFREEEDRDKQSSQKEMLNQEHLPSSPLESPPSSSIRLTECKETATDVQGKLSPVSVLEPLFTDDDSSPTTCTRFSSAEMRMQPLCIRFDEADSPKPEKDNNVKTSIDDKELTLAYIEAVVKSSGLSWDELLTRPFYSEQLLELTDDIVFSSTQLCDDKNLLYDCINEVLMDFCWNEFNPGPWISFLKPEVQLMSDMEIAAKVAREGVYWHLLPLPSPHTLDQIVEKDMARTGSWMNLRFQIGCLGSYTSELILDELIEEIIRSFRDMVQAEPMQDQISDNL